MLSTIDRVIKANITWLLYYLEATFEMYVLKKRSRGHDLGGGGWTRVKEKRNKTGS